MELEIVVVFCSSSLFITANANNAAGDNDAVENSEKIGLHKNGPFVTMRIFSYGKRRQHMGKISPKFPVYGNFFQN